MPLAFVLQPIPLPPVFRPGFPLKNRFSFYIFLLISLFFFVLPFTAYGEDTAKGNPLEGDMVFISAGNFPFGTNLKDEEAHALSVGIPKPWYIDESPEQKVFLKGFYIDRYEVTNARYQVYINDLGAIAPPHWKDNKYPKDQAEFPVVWVNWYDAANFCSWAGKELPSEKQWERAARGSEGRQYPWGNKFDQKRANLPEKQGSKNTATKVGSFPQGATPEGVQDMVGNVWEWTRDDYAPYKGSTFESPFFNNGYKVTRGTSAQDVGHFPGALYFQVLQQFARSGYRQHMDPEDSAVDIGFRCISTTKPKAMEKAGPGFKGASGASGFSKPSSAPGATGEVSSPFDSGSSNADIENFNPFQPKSGLPESGILVLILISFIAGVFSFLSPCTLPILPAYFAITAQADRARMSMMSLSFFCGLATLFVIMGASASALGQFLRDYLFQITRVGGVLIVIFGIMTLLGYGFSGANFRQKPASSYVGFFLFGATFALGWTPCVGPILSGILILAASDKTIFQGMSLLFFYAVGLGFPLIIISTFFGNLSKDSLFWRVLRGKGWNVNLGKRTLFLHSTNLFSGILLIVLGVVLGAGYMTYINSIVPIEIQIWFSKYEESFLNWFQ